MTESQQDIVLTDLSAPVFSESARELLGQVASVAPMLEIAPQSLMDTAAAETGLTDFGDPWFLEPLEVLCSGFNTEAGLSDVGKTMVWAQLSGMLKNRLLIEQAVSRHPEIEELDVSRPIIIAGLPRTGTTHLHNLLSADPGLRHLPYWESLEPLLSDAERGVEPDPRYERAAQGLDVVNDAMPHFRAMHDMTADHAHEEIQLLALTFSTMFFETLAPMPTYRDWLKRTDQTPAYANLKRELKVLQWARGGDRWVLKSPQHLSQFPVLFKTFPDATFVVTHRDPASVTISMATMAAYTARLQLAAIDPVRIGGYWSARVEDLLRDCTANRSVLPADQSLDIRFDDFMADEWGTIERIYAVAGQPLTDDARRSMEDFIRTHPRNRHGRIAYDAKALGIDADDRRRALSAYIDAFVSFEP
jgi:hypothetical protein